MALWGLIPAAIGAASSIYEYSTRDQNPYGRQIAELREQTAEMTADMRDRTLYKSMMRPATRMAGQQSRKAQREIEIMQAEGSIGEGAQAQAQISLAGETTGQLVEASEKAMTMQEQANIRARERMDAARMQIAQLRDQTRAAETAAEQGLVGGLAGAAGSAVSTVGGHFTQKALSKDVKDILGGEGTTEDKLLALHALNMGGSGIDFSNLPGSGANTTQPSPTAIWHPPLALE